MMVPIITGSLSITRIPPISSNARGIYTQIYAASTENIGGKTNYWAASEPDIQYANYQPNSTDYFRWLMTPYDIKNPAAGAEVVQQDFGAFAAPGMEPANSLDEFSAEANPWMVVADLDERSPSGIPFMITRNFNEMWLKALGENSREPLAHVGAGSFAKPYGREALFVVRIGGGAEILNEKQLFWGILNPTTATNRVLRP